MAKDNGSTSKTRFITDEGILSYPHLDTAQEPENGDGPAKFSAVLVLPPGTDLTKYKAAILAAAEAKWPGKAKKMFETGALRSPLRRDAEEKGYTEGSVFFSARTTKRPGVVYAHAGADGKPEKMDPADVKEQCYPGCKVRMSVAAFAYDKKGNKGVGFALNNVQKLGEGDRLDTHVAAEDEFTADLSAAPADLDSLI